MHLRDVLHALTAQAAPAGDAPPGCAGFGMGQMVFILLMFAVIWFMMIRPQQKQQRQHQDMLANLKKGDEVITQGGMIGRVYSVTDRVVTLEVSRDVRLRVLKPQIAALWSDEASGAQDTEKK